MTNSELTSALSNLFPKFTLRTIITLKKDLEQLIKRYLSLFPFDYIISQDVFKRPSKFLNLLLVVKMTM